MIDELTGQGKPVVGATRPINASFGKGNQGKVKAPVALDWDELVEFVQQPTIADITHAEYLALPKNKPKGTPKDVFVDTQSYRKTNDRFVLFGSCADGQRDDDHLIGRSAITLDYDANDCLSLISRLRAEAILVPFSFVWHTTRSYANSLDGIAPKVRLIIPLSRDVDAAEYHLLVRVVSKLFSATLDEAALKPSQMMYCPIHNINAPYRRGGYVAHGYLNPDQYLDGVDSDEATSVVVHEKRRALARVNGDDYDPMINAEPPLSGFDRAKVEEMLGKLDPDMEYPDWMSVGRALHHQFRGLAEGLDIWEAWSANGAKHEEGACETKWQELNVSPAVKPTTFKSVITMVQDAETEEADSLIERWKTRIEEATDRQMLEKRLLKGISKVSSLSELARKQLAKLVQVKQKLLFGAALDIREIEKRMTPVDPEDAHDYTKKSELTELGNAYRMHQRFGKQLRYTGEDGAWYQWVKVYWKRVPEEWVASLARSTIEDMHNELTDMTGNARADFYAWCQRSETNGMFVAMTKIFRSLDGVLIPYAALDADPNLFGCGNGAVDLSTGELQKPYRDDLITVTTSVPYNPDAACPLFEKVVSDAFFDDMEMVNWFQRVIGYSMLARPKEDFVVIPYGDGSNGKSTILGAIQRVFGGHAKGTSSATFMQDARGAGASASGPNEALLRLRGSRFVYMSEPEAGQLLRTSLVKSVTGGDILTARGVHAKQSVEFEPTWVVFMPTNHKPIIKDEDNGIWRRLKLIPFTRNFKKDIEVREDTGLEEKLKAEYEGILAWCVRGAIEYQRVGLRDEPRRVREAHGAYRTDMDVLHEWLDDRFVADPMGKVSNGELWASWQEHAQKAGSFMLVPSQKHLTRRLTDRGYRPYRSSTERGFWGIARKAETSDSQGFLD